MPVFDLFQQNTDLDRKIVAGLERLSQVFRQLLWDQAKEYQLSPIQIQILIFIRYHGPEYNNVSNLAREFGVTKPTVSDAVKTLEQKNLLLKIGDPGDSRRSSLQLTQRGEDIALKSAQYADPFTGWLEGITPEEKENLWKQIAGLILSFNRAGIISVQRTCYNCRYYEAGAHYCSLLDTQLLLKDIRIDCPEFSE